MWMACGMPPSQKNLADGFGSFWSPAFSHTIYPVFYEHPPLVFGIQSLFFKVLGDGFYVENIYSLFIIFLTLIGINILWKTIFRDKPELKGYGFIPCILWILHEPVYVFYSNNMLECSQGIFILSAVILILKGLINSDKPSYLFIFLAGISLIFSFLSKGFTGLYPLITIIIYALIYKNLSWRKVVLYNGILWGSFCLIIVIYLINSSAADNINNYIDTQVIAALLGERTEHVHISRFWIIRRLLQTSILPILLVACLSLISFYKFGAKHFFLHKKEILFFLVLGLSGVLPMMISKKQGTYYLLTIYPYFAIVLSLILIRSESLLTKLKVSKAFRIISYSLLLFSLIFSSFSINKVNKRDQTPLSDFDQLAQLIPSHSTLGCVVKINESWIYGIFMRIHYVSFDTLNPYDYSLLLGDKDFHMDHMDSSLFRAIDLQTVDYTLYEKLE